MTHFHGVIILSYILRLSLFNVFIQGVYLMTMRIIILKVIILNKF